MPVTLQSPTVFFFFFTTEDVKVIYNLFKKLCVHAVFVLILV